MIDDSLSIKKSIKVLKTISKPCRHFENSPSRVKNITQTVSSITPLSPWLTITSVNKLNEQLEILGKDEKDPKAREIFHEASRTLEMANPDDLRDVGETMFDDMHECPEKQKEVDRLKEVQDKLQKFVGIAADNRKKYKIFKV